MENWQVKFIEQPDRLGRGLYIYRLLSDNRLEVLLANGTTEVSVEGTIHTPTLFLNEDMFQMLVNAVHKDFKPSEGKFTEGKLEATERHLNDLRFLLKLPNDNDH
jgi:hypothetical protein